MRVRFLVLMALTLFVVNCSEVENGNQDSASEISCASASGNWVVSSVTCDGVANTSFGSMAFAFNSSTSVTQTQGSTACSGTVDWTAEHVAFNNSLNLTGVGAFRCSANNATVSSCSTSLMDCDSSVDATGFQNNFETCAIRSSNMIVSRTVSSTNNPNGFAVCTDGEVEEMTLTQAASDPTGPAVLTISNDNPAVFGTVATGGSQQLTFNMSNSGAEAATAISASGLAAPYSFFGGSYPGTGGTCGASLAGGASCTFVVSFNPTVAGTSTDDISIAYNDSAAVQSLTHGVTGAGVNGGSSAVLTISESDPYDFGTRVVGSSSQHTFTVTNIGSATATSISEVGLAAPFGFSGGSFPGTGGTCSATLSAAAACQLVVEFSPVSVGVASDAILLNYNNGLSTQSASRSVQGTGVNPGLLVISDGPVFDFGSVQASSSSSKVFTVTNLGGFTAIALSGGGLAAPFSFTGGAYPGVGGTCGSSLAPASNCTIQVRYAPVVVGSDSDTLNLDYNDGASTQQASRNLLGSGTP